MIDPGDNEIYDPKTKKWTPGPKHYFPTYPALFLTKGGKLFYPASNAGYGPADNGPRARAVGPEDQQVREGAGAERHRPDGDVGVPAAAARPRTRR